MVKSTMTGTVPSSGRSETAVAMAQNEQTAEEHSTLEQQPPGRLDHPAWCVCVDGTTSVDVEALRRRRREPTSAVTWRVSARYDGAVPLRQRYARTHNRNGIFSRTASLCSSRKSEVIEIYDRCYNKYDCEMCYRN